MSHAGSDAGNTIKKGLTGFHGAGENIRGQFNTFVDQLTFTDKPDSKNHEIADRGEREMRTGVYESHNSGVTPADTPHETGHGETGHTGHGGLLSKDRTNHTSSPGSHLHAGTMRKSTPTRQEEHYSDDARRAATLASHSK